MGKWRKMNIEQHTATAQRTSTMATDDDRYPEALSGIQEHFDSLERAGKRVLEREAREEAYVLRAADEVKAACLRGEVIPGADPDGCIDPDSLARYIGRELSEMTVQWAWDRLVARGEIVYCEEDAP